MKLTLGLNFIKVLQAAFTLADHECAKKRQSSWQCCLALLGLASVKAARKMLMKSTWSLLSQSNEALTYESHIWWNTRWTSKDSVVYYLSRFAKLLTHSRNTLYLENKRRFVMIYKCDINIEFGSYVLCI